MSKSKHIWSAPTSQSLRGRSVDRRLGVLQARASMGMDLSLLSPIASIAVPAGSVGLIFNDTHLFVTSNSNPPTGQFEYAASPNNAHLVFARALGQVRSHPSITFDVLGPPWDLDWTLYNEVYAAGDFAGPPLLTFSWPGASDVGATIVKMGDTKTVAALDADDLSFVQRLTHNDPAPVSIALLGFDHAQNYGGNADPSNPLQI